MKPESPHDLNQSENVLFLTISHTHMTNHKHDPDYDPKNSRSSHITARVTGEARAKILREAQAKGESMSEYIAKAIDMRLRSKP